MSHRTTLSTLSRRLPAAALLLALAPAAQAATFTVLNTSVSGVGSLRQAILDANATDEADTIQFAIPNVGTQTIGGSLPSILKPVTIDGYTQPTSSVNTATDDTTNAALRIRLIGDSLHTGDAVLTVASSDVVIRGLAIGHVKPGGSAIQVNAHMTGVKILGCFIGTTSSGLDADRLPASASGTGILVEGTATVGTPLPADRNLISGNDDNGVLLTGTQSTVDNNLIGTDRNGEALLGNGKGVFVKGAAAILNTIGGIGDASGNLIAGNVAEGIRVDAAPGNRFERNRIRDNGALGIDLGPAGPTPNDDGDADSGANHLQNFPVVDFARVNGGLLTVSGLLESLPGEYLVEFFVSSQPDPSGYGEAETYAGSLLVDISQTKTSAAFSTPLEIPDPGDETIYVTATAQNIENQETSEFSLAVSALDGGTELSVVNTNDSGDGSLRAALEAANADPDPNTIVFDIPGSNVKVIQPLTPLVATGGPLIVDGYTQTGAKPNTLASGTNAQLRVVIDGSKLEGDAPGLDVVETGAIVRGLAIRGAPGAGIRGVEAVGLVVEGSFLGTDVTGTADFGNGTSGVETGDSFGTLIGGAFLSSRNLLSGNAQYGILDDGEGTEVQGNLIGSSADGSGDLGNGLAGIRAEAGSVSIGGDSGDLANLIRGNAGNGIEVAEGTSGVVIAGNSITGNGALGIDLLAPGGFAGVTPNDFHDGDSGANALQNFPVLTSVEALPGKVHVEGTLDVPMAASDASYTIRVFANDSCDVSQHGEGATFLGAAPVQLSGDAESFAFDLPAIASDQVVQITATATDEALGNTSEFSECTEVTVVTPVCGDISLDGKISASDALGVLKAAVGTIQCALCVCDTNANGTLTSPDALLVLKAAVGQQVTLTCPACA